MRTFTSLEIRFEYVLVGKLPNRRIIRRKIRSCDSGISESKFIHMYFKTWLQNAMISKYISYGKWVNQLFQRCTVRLCASVVYTISLILCFERGDFLLCNASIGRLPRDGPGFDSRWEQCIYRASRPSQGTVNGGAVSKWSRCWRDVKHKQTNKLIGRLIFHYDNDNDYENDNEISLSFSVRFCTFEDEWLIASISSSTTTIMNRNPGISQEMMMSAHKNFVLVRVVVVVVQS